MKIKDLMRALARETADELVSMIERAGRRGATSDALAIQAAHHAFREGSADNAIVNDYVREWRYVRIICAHERPMRAAQRRLLLSMLALTSATAYDFLRLVPQDLAVLDEASPTTIVAHLALRAGAYDGEPRSATYLATPEGKKLLATLKQLVERNVRKRKEPTFRIRHAVIWHDEPPPPNLRLVGK